MIKNIDLEGAYKLDDNKLVGKNITLSVGKRHRPKKGQAQRFIGYIDASKPPDEQFSYISSLYSKQGLKNVYTLDYNKQPYQLSVTGLNRVEITKTKPEKVLEFDNSGLSGVSNE